MHVVERGTDLFNWFQYSLELQSPKCPNNHTIDSTFAVHLSLNVTGPEKKWSLIFSIGYPDVVRSHFFPLSIWETLSCARLARTPRRARQIQSARSGWGTWTNSSPEGPDTSFADILVENHLCLVLREPLFQQMNIVWPIISKCINHYYQTHVTLSISRSQSLNNFRHHDWKYCCWSPVSLVYRGYVSICRETQSLSTRLWKTLTFYIVVRGQKRNWISLL